MSASYEKLGRYEEMEEAGRSCIKADSKFVKGYFGLATALKALNKNADCIKTLEVSNYQPTTTNPPTENKCI